MLIEATDRPRRADGMRLPRVKAEHRPHRHPDGTVRIGGEIYGLAAEIDDPRGWVWGALCLMDGHLAPQGISLRLRRTFPGMSAGQADTVIATLLGSGYVEDAHAAPPPELSAAELDRYDRNHSFFRRVDLTPREHGWESQLRLRAATVLVLGLGGTGGHAAWALAAAGVGTIHCVDPDLVELSNLNRQVLYDEGDVGRPKVTAALARLRRVNSAITITGERRRVASAAELALLLEGFDVLALCADEPHDLRIWANRACAAAGVPWVGGGYSGPLVTAGVFAPGHPCYECLRAGEEARRRPGTPVDLGGPGVLATSAGLSGQLTAQAVITLVTGVPDIEPGYVHGVNLMAPDHLVHIRHPSRPDCPVCVGP
jgi:molybdopterin/thiamine biosynthesis adenylyltransferase